MKSKRNIVMVDLDKLMAAIVGLRATKAQAILDAVIREESPVEGHVSENGCALEHQPS